MELGNNRTLAQLRAFTTKDVHLNYSVSLTDAGKEGVFPGPEHSFTIDEQELKEVK